MKLRILEYKSKLELTASLKEEINLEKEYKDVIVIKSQFNEFIEFVITSRGVLPSASSKSKEEKKLGKFRNNIQNIRKEGRFLKILTKTQLQYLHDSEYESLRELYKIILYKAVMNNVEIDYVDEKMKLRILEYKSKLELRTSLEEEINLEKKYKDVIVIKSQFNEFIEFVNDNYGLLPSGESNNEIEKRLGKFRSSTQSITKKGNFATTLTNEQLQYLHDSEYESLREIYKNILYKAVMNNVEIDYVDEKMKLRILEYKSKLELRTSLEEEINLEKEYKDVIVIGSLFNEFIEFVNDNYGLLPSAGSKKEKEKRLGGFRNNIQSITKGRKFYKNLTNEQLQYLHDSEYESLRSIYDKIMEKAKSINYQPYIDVNNELENRRKVA